MPIILGNDNQSYNYLSSKDVPIINPERASSQDIRPLEIAICNLMPQKQITEKQLFRLLGNTPLQINPTLFMFDNINKNKKNDLSYYKSRDEVKSKKYDGLIVTGANAEKLLFEKSNNRDQVKEMFERSVDNTFRNMYICRGAMAGLHEFFGIKKHVLDKKIFDVKKFGHDGDHYLLTGLDDDVYMPISCRAKSIIDKNNEVLELVLGTHENPAIVSSNDNKHTFIIPHPEYDRGDLSKEYMRDILSGIDINIPQHYFINEDDIYDFVELDRDDKIKIILSLPDQVRNEIFDIIYLKDRSVISSYREMESKKENISDEEISKRSKALKPKLMRRANAQVIFNNWIKKIYDDTAPNVNDISKTYLSKWQ